MSPCSAWGQSTMQGVAPTRTVTVRVRQAGHIPWPLAIGGLSPGSSPARAHEEAGERLGAFLVKLDSTLAADQDPRILVLGYGVRPGVPFDADFDLLAEHVLGAP